MELRRRLIAAAEQVFGERGYAATTTKDLARAAEVTESVMYRHFPSKAALFQEALLIPFIDVLARMSATSVRHLDEPIDNEMIVRLFVGDLVEELTRHRSTVRCFLAAADQFDSAVREGVRTAIDDVIVKIGEITKRESSRRGGSQRQLGSEMTIRATVSMAMGLVAFDDLLQPSGSKRPTPPELVNHLTEMLVYGA